MFNTPEDFFPWWEQGLRESLEKFPDLEKIVRKAMLAVDDHCESKLAAHFTSVPVNLDKVAEALGYDVIRRDVMGPQINFKEKKIWLQKDAPKFKDRLYLGHEIAHHFYDYPISQYTSHNVFNASADELEYICDRTAEMLVVPRALLRQHCPSSSVDLDVVRELADLFEVSPQIIGRRIADIHFSADQLVLL